MLNMHFPRRTFSYPPLYIAGVTWYSCLMKFLEDLSIQNMTCPPKEAAPGRFVVYRLVDNVPMKTEDIWSQRALYPAKVFKGVDECVARACSVFTDCNDLNNVRKIPRFRMKKVVAIAIGKKDGVLLNTFADSHFSWWISREFKLAAVKLV